MFHCTSVNHIKNNVQLCMCGWKFQCSPDWSTTGWTCEGDAVASISLASAKSAIIPGVMSASGSPGVTLAVDDEVLSPMTWSTAYRLSAKDQNNKSIKDIRVSLYKYSNITVISKSTKLILKGNS